ncbi:hypothetical protein AZI86_00230 [Bdellovibrio bacteriovorus]|uniref:histidine kinase n=1 Tax=Bdellovibrio bacteriovorus TaxID=959 RepID=A0A150WM59_BDEBC|nr:HAMP domain-containing sensor histidine kinase [Bdellovibrio bacteriovorus]KYG65542.1 hypothetical protein AZI86_00230 [Bdellovibrio bacteriovorus]
MSLDYRSIFESAPDLYVILLPDCPRFTILAATEEFARQTHTVKKDLIDRSLFEVFPDNEEARLFLTRVVEQKQTQKMLIASPSEKYWSAVSIPIFEGKELKYILHRVTDVTEYQKTNEQLKAAIGIREDILAIVSHDLKNPLGSIEMSLDILKESLRGEETLERVKMFKIIERSVRHMKRLIGDLLSFAKIQSGNFTIEMQRFSLRKLLLDAQHAVLHSAIKKRIHIRVDIKTQSDVILCDHDRLLEVLSNILGNAIKFSRPGGFVRLKVCDQKDCYHFSVHDEGPGIAPENMPHLFDRYWQAKETAHQGVGLGLAIAKGIVIGHHGEIWAESVPGSGTTMHFTIPRDFHLELRSKAATKTDDPIIGLNLAKP